MKSSLLFLFSVLTTFTSTAQWQKQLSGTSENLNDVAVLNQSSAVVVGDNGAILKTTDKGLNWVSKNSSTTNNLNAVSFRNEENGIAVGNGIICRTSDGGETWVFILSSDNLISPSYRNPYFGGSNILKGSENGKVIFSSDDGNTWGDTLLFPNQSIVAVGFNYYSPSLSAPIVYSATTYHTGTTFFPSYQWNLYDNPVNPAWDVLTGGEFYDGSQYLIGWGGNPGPIPLLLRRINSDTLWEATYQFVPPQYIPEDIKSINETLFVCGSDGKIFKSTDSGDNWFEQTTETNEDLSAVSFYDELIGYVVGKNGIILYTSDGGVTSVEEHQQPTGFKLYQNYPNPFNPITNIEFWIADFVFVSLKVYDVLGNEVSTLINEEKQEGSYGVQFDGGNLSSEIYFYELRTENFSSVKKMILMK